MDLYKDKECTEPAKCPISYSNPLINQYRTYTCETNCAWCVLHKDENAYTCGVTNVCQLMYAEAVE